MEVDERPTLPINRDSGARRVGLLVIVFIAIIAAAMAVIWQLAANNSHQTTPTGMDDRRDVDLGKVPSVADVKCIFAVFNSTGMPFKIVAVQKSCGCQTARVAEGTLVPAGSVLEVPYSMPGKAPGVQTGRLVINTDATSKSFKEIVLTLRAEIQPQLWATPAQLLFGAVREGEAAQQDLRIESLVPGLLDTFREAITSRENVTVELRHKSSEALVFRVALSPNATLGEIHDFVSLGFDDRDFPQLNVRVRAYKGGRVAVIPKAVTLLPFLGDETQHQRVRVMSVSRSLSKFRIQHVECAQDISVEGISAEPRNGFDLTINFTQPAQRRLEHTITFHTEPQGKATMVIKYTSPVGG